MKLYRLGDVELRFAEIVWREAPIPSPDLVKICESELNWKKSTTYTVLRKLCQRGLFKNENTIVKVVMTREEYDAAIGSCFVEESFNNSLPAFIAAFMSGKKLTKKEADEIRRMIDSYEEK